MINTITRLNSSIYTSERQLTKGDDENFGNGNVASFRVLFFARLHGLCSEGLISKGKERAEL